MTRAALIRAIVRLLTSEDFEFRKEERERGTYMEIFVPKRLASG